MSTARPARRLLALSAVAALLLAGCSSEGDDPDGGTAPGTADAAMPTASGAFGEEPEIEFTSETPPEGLQVEVLEEGDGDAVAPSSVVTANYYGIVWGADEPFDGSYSRGAPSMFPLANVIEGWSTGIPDNAVGSRLLMSVPPELGYGPAGGNADAGIGAEDTIVFVIDIVEAFGPDQAGQADAAVVTPADQLPVTVDGEPGAPATLTVAAGAAEPTEPSATVVAEGTGEPVAAGQSVAIAYAATYWDGSVTESSWGTDDQPGAGPNAVPTGGGSIFDGLIGVPVGSRVLLVAPATEQGPPIAWLVDVLGTA